MRKTCYIFCVVIFASSLSLAAVARDESSIEFNIEAATLVQALQQFSEQTKLHVMFPSSVAKFNKSISLSGSFTPFQALTKLLEGTELEYIFDGENNIAIRPSAARRADPRDNHLKKDLRVSSFYGSRDTEIIFEELVVTAQKRAQRISEVPIAISAFSRENISQTSITQLRELADFIPNLQFSRSTDFTSAISIRGVGSNSRNIGFDTRVGVYLDGVYLGQSPAVNQELIDLERIEVLRGPQGTLFGKNTVAGAINLISEKPTDEFNGHLSVSAGNLNALEAHGSLNIPVSDSVAATFSISESNRDGYVKNLYTGNDLNERDSFAYRTQLQARLAENFEANLAFDSLESQRFSFLGEPATDTFATTTDTVAPKKDEVSLNTDTFEEREIYGASINLDYLFANNFTLKSITAYRDTDIFYRSDSDYSQTDWTTVEYADMYGQFSQEVQLLSPALGQPLSYVMGLYYYRQNAETRRDAINGEASILIGNRPGTIVFNDGKVITHSYAGYFNGSYYFTKKLALGFGLRYTDEAKEVDWLLDGSESGSSDIASTNGNLRDERDDTHTSYAISLSYLVNENINSYIKYSTGFKSGGYNLDYVNSSYLAAGIEFDKETVGSYELGLKTRFLNNRIILNCAVFYSIFEDYQVNQYIDLGNNTASITIRNAAEVETKGLEAELVYRPIDQLEIQASAGYLNARFNNFPGGLTNGGNADGKNLTTAPEFNYYLSVQYFKGIPELEAEILFRADATYTDNFFTTVDNRKTLPLTDGTKADFGHIESTKTINARIGLRSYHRTWETYIWGRNLTNERKPVDNLQDFFGTVVVNHAEPRTYGVELVWNF